MHWVIKLLISVCWTYHLPSEKLVSPRNKRKMCSLVLFSLVFLWWRFSDWIFFLPSVHQFVCTAERYYPCTLSIILWYQKSTGTDTWALSAQGHVLIPRWASSVVAKPKWKVIVKDTGFEFRNSSLSFMGSSLPECQEHHKTSISQFAGHNNQAFSP